MCESFQCGFKIPVRIGSAIVANFFFLKRSDRKHSWGLLMFGYSAGKSDAKPSEEPVDWSFAVLELLREQGWDVKEINDRYKRVIY